MKEDEKSDKKEPLKSSVSTHWHLKKIQQKKNTVIFGALKVR